MAQIKQQGQASLWPWGGPRSVQERLVEPSQIDRRRKTGKKGDPKNPALASAELLDFIGPAHSADEMRLPMPPMPAGHEADVSAFGDRPYLADVARRGDAEDRKGLEMALGMVNVPADRKERLKALLGREAQMLQLVGHIHEEMVEIQRRMREEQREEGY